MAQASNVACADMLESHSPGQFLRLGRGESRCVGSLGPDEWFGRLNVDKMAIWRSWPVVDGIGTSY